MVKVLILVEGQTEETFVRDILEPHFKKINLHCIAKLATTKRVKSGPDFKGGIVSYDKLKKDILRLLGDTSATAVTTMIDYYGFPQITPFGKSITGNSCFEKVKSLETLFKQDISNSKFIPYLQLHEFEALVFTSPKEIAKKFGELGKEHDIAKNMMNNSQFKSPEEINDNPASTPSKRLIKLFPSYQKTADGPLITKRIGLDTIRSRCQHFNDWIKQLENLNKQVK